MSSFFIFFTAFTVLILVGQLSLKVKTTKENGILSQLTVVIPFRNEARNLSLLLRSIALQDQLPVKIIFVNDHSDDASVAILEDFNGFELEIVELVDGFGKKAALKKGIQAANTDYILTLDADTQLPENYFKTLSETQLGEAHILPVRICNTPFSGFFNLDYYYLFMLNNGLHFFKRPFVASGANFLFKKAIYEAFIAQDLNQSVSSGDDHYFLHYLVKNKKDIRLSTDDALCVETTIPSSFGAILQQRIRWIKKSSSYLSLTALMIAFIGVIYHWGIIALTLLYSSKAVELLLTKIAFDCIVFYPYLIRIGERFSLVRIAIFSLLYPFWMFFIGVASVFVRPQWKGRKVQF